MRTNTSIVIVLASLLVAACGAVESKPAAEASTDTAVAAPAAAPATASATDSATPTGATPATVPQVTTTTGTSPWAPPPTTAPAPPVAVVDPIAKPAAAGSAADGAALFAAKCTSCHGKEARGNTAMGRKYGIKDFRSPEVRAMTTTDLAKVMKLGAGKLSEGAHPKANLSDQDVIDMVAFIQSLM